MSTRKWKAAPVLSVVAATAIALACGTNYGYSAWAPSFADRLRLSSTQQNLIGTWGNLGQYASGIPAGMLVDNRGPRLSILLGSIAMGIGYMFCYKAFADGPGSTSVAWICLFSAMTGAGGCASFVGALKTAALNFPERRGTATAFPLAAFGLSAFFFSSISSLAFPDNTADLLLFLAILTFSLPFVGNFFLRLPSQPVSYMPLHVSDEQEEDESATKLSRFKNNTSHHNHSREDQGTRTAISSPETDDTASLLSESSVDGPNEPQLAHADASDPGHSDSHMPDIRGLTMLKYPKFYQLWGFLGLMTGIGLMTINNIGGDTRALWRHWDDSASAELIQKRQLNQVELLSIMSFIGRLLSGIGSDVLVRQLHASRFWCPVISAALFILAQLSAIFVTTPGHLFLVSGSSGLAYGFLFGCYPALVAETFGVNGMTQNWGFMTLSVVPGAHLFNLFYGTVYDAHSAVKKDGSQGCREGIDCYRSAYYMTLIAAGVGLVWSLACVRYDWTKRRNSSMREKGVIREA